MHTHPTVSSEPSDDEEYLPVPWSFLADYRCFGCSPHNPTGLRLRFRTRPDGIETRFTLDRSHESYPGIVHGGLIGVICDETMGNLIVLRAGLTAFTTSMRMRYFTAMRVNAEYRCVARLRAGTSEPISGRGDAGGLVHAEAEVFDAAGSPVAAASAAYMPTPADSARQRLDMRPEEFDQVTRILAARADSASQPGTGQG